MNKELLDKLQDPKFYLENLCKIKLKRGGMAPFILNNAQRDLFNSLRKSNRILILKSRQIGFSTAVTGFLYHMAITTDAINVALIGYNSDLVRELLDKVKTFYATTPDPLKPKIQYNSKFEITFPMSGSKIVVLPSSENVGRGWTLHAVLATELAFWDKPDEKMAALESAVPSNGLIVIESTPNGIGNTYHRMWMQQDNGYVKKEYGWWWHYSEEEIAQIRRRMDPRKFAQEYELVFLSSGRPVFNPESVDAQRKNILNVGDPVPDQEGSTVKKQPDGLVIYKLPEPKHFYVAGVDVSEGVHGGDYSVCTILDRTSGEEVACYRGLEAPDKLGTLLNKWGRMYNDALMVVEINNHGLTTLTMLKQLIYPSIYFRPSKFDAISSPWSDKMGWRTTKVTRELLIDDLVEAIREESVIIHSEETINEMTTFNYDRGNTPIAAEGFHDDTIFATAIALQGFKVMYDKELTQINYQRHLPATFSY